jgi:exodeoxyribonuclease-3
MSHFKIATWNVNSLRVRLPHVLTWLDQHKPDVLALQETKLPDADFPVEAILQAGYEMVFSGQKTYNGVAILSRNKSSDIITDLLELEDPQRRVLAAVVDDIRILNLYIPNGQSVGSEKYEYKLNWLNKLDLFLKEELKKHPKIIVLGDFNIAPQAIDVHDPKRWEGKVLFSEPERKAFQDMLQVGFIDCFRQLNPEEKIFSWWDYRTYGFSQNLGLRIDHILASDALISQCKKCYIDTELRKEERPSDHAPVVAEFELS